MHAEQLDLWGKSKEEKSIERLRMFEPPEGSLEYQATC